MPNMAEMCASFGAWLKGNILLLLMIIAMIAGITAGWIISASGVQLTEKQIVYLTFPGELLIRALKMVIIPLLVSSLIAGLAQLDIRESGKIGLRAVAYYSITTFIAISVGVTLSVTIRPGERVRGTIPTEGEAKQMSTTDAMLDLLRLCVPSNLVEATFRSDGTYTPPVIKPFATDNSTNNTEIVTFNETDIDVTTGRNYTDWLKWKKETEKFRIVKKDSMNILGLVVFSIVFGMICSDMRDKCQILIDFFNAINDATMKLVGLIMWYSPIGIFFLIMANIAGFYSATVVLGLLFHGWILLPLIFLLITRTNPVRYIGGLVPALLTALGTSSSSATLPVTFNCLENNNGVDKRITRFVLPIGATINMDGTALYEAVAPIFIAQYRGFYLSFADVLTIAITATFASIGAAGIPQAGLVTMVMVLTSVGLDPNDVTLILAVDWLLDRFRTVTNVLGDSLGAGIVGHLSKKELRKLDENDKSEVELGELSGGEDPQSRKLLTNSEAI